MRALLGVAVVVVRVYDVTGIADADRRVALEVAQELLATANAHVIFKVCHPDESNRDPCNTTRPPDERIVRVINSPSSPRSGLRESLGNAVVDAVTNTGVLATIYADRVIRRAAGRIDHSLLLGRTIAHELGHLLLGGTHSKSGLMREFWSDQELQRNHVTDWAFAPEDRRRICAQLLRAESLCSGNDDANVPGRARTTRDARTKSVPPAGDHLRRALFDFNPRGPL